MSGINDAMKTDIAFVGGYVRTQSGDLDRITGLANLKNALYHRLVTTPGTLVHRPEYGVGILNYQGAPSSITDAAKACATYRRAIQARFESGRYYERKRFSKCRTAEPHCHHRSCESRRVHRIRDDLHTI
jgi:phage baseplate assembly protein W